VLARFSVDGVIDTSRVLTDPDVDIDALTHIGGDQFLGIFDDQLYQYDLVANVWTLVTTLAQSFPDAGLAFDFGMLYATRSGSNQLFKIDLSDFTIVALGSTGSTANGAISTSCMLNKNV
jgi:hypothetical protein